MPFASSSLPRTTGRTALDHRHGGIRLRTLKLPLPKSLRKERLNIRIMLGVTSPVSHETSQSVTALRFNKMRLPKVALNRLFLFLAFGATAGKQVRVKCPL